METTYDKSRAIRRQRHGLRSQTVWCKMDRCPYAWSCEDFKEGRAVYGERCMWLTRAEEVWLILAQVELGVRLDVLDKTDQDTVRTFVRSICRRLHTQLALGGTDMFVAKLIQTPAGPFKEIRVSPEQYHDARAASQYTNANHRFDALRRRIWKVYGKPKQTVADVLKEAGVELGAEQLWM